MKPSELIKKNAENHPLSDYQNAIIFEILEYLDNQADQHVQVCNVKCPKCNVYYPEGFNHVCANEAEQHAKKDEECSLLPSEALFGFCAWLTTRNNPITASSRHDAGEWACLVDEFCKANKLTQPRNNWTDYLTHPKPSPSSEPVKQISLVPLDENELINFISKNFNHMTSLQLIKEICQKFGQPRVLSVEEIQKILMRFIPYKEYETKVAMAIHEALKEKK